MRVLFGFLAVGFVSTACADDVVLANEFMRLEFAGEDTGFGVLSVSDLSADGQTFVRPRDDEAAFWRLSFRAVDSEGQELTTDLSNLSPAAARSATVQDGVATFVWRGLTLPHDAGAVDVVATVTMSDCVPASVWTLKVTNRSAPWKLARTEYPLLRDVTRGRSADVLVPSDGLGGRVLRQCAADSLPNRSVPCPGDKFPLAFYACGNSGLYVAAHDGESRLKTMCLENDGDIWFETPVEQDVETGAAADGPRYPVVIACTRGDWWRAAKIYGAWATCQRWAVRRRPNGLEPDLLVVTDGTPEETDGLAAALESACPPGVRACLSWTGWSFLGAGYPFQGLPLEFPMLESAVTNGIARWTADGLCLAPAVGGRFWNTMLASYRYAQADACRADDGSAVSERCADERLAVMCPCCAHWQNVVRTNAVRVLDELGATAVTFGRIAGGAPAACSDRTHGHPVGGGSGWAEGYRQMLTPLRAEFERRGAMMVCERAGEACLDLFDASLDAVPATDGDVPLFSAVYGGCCRHGVHCPDLGDFLSCARMILLGETPVCSGEEILAGAMPAGSPYGRLSEFRRAHADFLVSGSLEGELQLLDPDEDVIGSVWSNADGTRWCAFIANGTDMPRSIRFVSPTSGRIAELSVEPKAIGAYETKGNENMNAIIQAWAFGLAASLAVVTNAGAEVRSDFQNRLQTEAASFTAVTEKCRALPAGMPTPIFWLDCSSTNGWEFSGAQVTKVPSLVGERYLTLTREPSNYPGWQPLAPDYVTGVAALNGGAMLDFGAVNSMKGLLFNAASEPAGAAPSNLLYRIATVVTVMDTSEGGGYFLGGGAQNSNGWGTDWFDGYLWLRGANNYLGANDASYIRQSVLGKYPGHLDFIGGYMRHNGMPIYNEYHGFNGEWETLTFRPRQAAGSEGRMTSCGISINDSRNFTTVPRGGGQKIAEMLIFSTVLSDAQSEQLEAYLQEKWFGAPKAGWNGNAYLSGLNVRKNSDDGRLTSYRVGLEAPERETLTVGTVRGGRRSDYNLGSADTLGLDKTGDGTLVLKDASSFGGDVRVKGGSIAFPKRAVPSEPPADVAVHLDASAADAFTTHESGGVTYVDTWKNLGNGKYQGNAIGVEALAANRVPTLLANAFGVGKPVVDFGAYHNDGTGAYLSFAAGGVAAPVSSVTTVIALLGLQGGGGSIVNGGFSRWTRQYGLVSYSDQLLDPAGITPREKSTSVLAPHPYYYTNGWFYVDGVRRDFSLGYPHTGYMVVAIQCASSDISAIGAMTDLSNAGGVRIGELLVYDRTLSERQIEDAQAYLMRKWFGRAAPGYAIDEETARPDLNDVVLASAGGTVEIPAGQTVRFGQLKITEPIEVTGGGTLVLDSNRDSGDMVTLKGASVVTGGAVEPASQCAMAASPALHLDAADTNRMEIVDGNVQRWYDTAFRNYAYQDDPGFRPTLKAEGLNGLPVLDFGSFATVASRSARFMSFCHAEDSIRSVFWVVKVKNEANSPLLGTSKDTFDDDGNNNSIYDYVRGAGKVLFIKNAVTAKVYGGQTLVDGVTVDPTAVTPAYDTFQLIENHATESASASALACDRWNGDSASQVGGQEIAEIIIYDRVLSARERTATRNYLRQKWFPDATIEELPVVDEGKLQPGDSRPHVAALDVTGGVSLTDGIVAGRLVGEGDVTKSGSGALEVRDLSSFTGEVTVASGTLKLSGGDPETASVGVVESGRIFHADATSGVTTELGAKGERKVVKWASKHDATWTAEPGIANCYPTLVKYPKGENLTAVDMAMNAKQCLVFKHNGSIVRLGDIRSIFWVIGSQNGGGFLMGGGTNAPRTQLEGGYRPYNFHRGWINLSDPLRYYDPNTTIIGDYRFADTMLVNKCDWYKNGAAIDATKTGLSGDWDLVDFNVKESDADAYTEAEGFAFDGRVLSDPSAAAQALYAPIVGCQRLAEVIIYNRRLTEAERLQNEAYLKAKWGVGVHSALTTGAKVVLAKGTELDLGGNAQHLVSVTGAGTVRNGDFMPDELVADLLADDCPTVEGTFTVREGQTVRLVNLAGADLPCCIPVLRADSYEGIDNLGSVTFVGEVPPSGSHARLVIRQGVLCVKIVPDGTMILIR